jgi:putative transposase
MLGYSCGPVIERRRCGRHLRARGYFVATSGNVIEEVLLEYIKNQDIDNQDEDFTIAE